MSESGLALVDATGPLVVREVDPLTSHRRDEEVRFDLLALDGTPLRELDTVVDATFDYSVHDTIRSGGTITVDMPQLIDWHRVHVQPWYSFTDENDGEHEWPLGVFIPAVPGTDHMGALSTAKVELYDKLLILDQDATEETYTVDVGVVVTDKVRELIAAVGESGATITESTETLAVAIVWEPNTSRLRIINDLLAAINYFSLTVDGWGRFHAAPYVPPAARGVSFTLASGDRSIIAPATSPDADPDPIRHEADGFHVPNKVVLVATSDGDTPAMVATAVNEDPLSPWSIPSRGRVIVHHEDGIEATSQAVLDNLAARRLIELSDVAATWQVRHAWIPAELNDVAQLAVEGVVDAPCVLQKTTFTNGLAVSTFREVTG
ncbi:hypothetical protein V2J56_09225 [Georgenia sp. MJ206]|uniref:hypothetical protein n=1 Tax=Georgenia wangjunii TaxID=3117730 RepID=UPI002F26D36E